MKNLILFFLIIPIYSNAQNGDKNFIDQNYIEVTGQMETELIPDEIYISITLNEKDKRGKESIEEQEIQMIRGLKSIGIDTDKYLSIQNFYGAYTNLFLKKDEVFKNKQFELLVISSLQLTKVFELFDVLEISNAGVNRVDHSEIENYKRESKIKALKIAKKKAEDYAHAIDQQIGKALFIEEISTNERDNFNVLNESIVIRGLGSTYSQNDKLLDKITIKKIKITATILAKFELI
jgi:hypothetical protein